MFTSSLWIIAVFQLFTDHENYVECLADHSASANAFSIFGYRYQFPFGILSWRRESSSIVTSPLIRLVNLQSSGYFCLRHEFLGFLGCGERSTEECSVWSRKFKCTRWFLQSPHFQYHNEKKIAQMEILHCFQEKLALVCCNFFFVMALYSGMSTLKKAP